MTTPIIITGIGSVSPLGADHAQARRGYADGRPRFQPREFGGAPRMVAPLSAEAEAAIARRGEHERRWRALDRSVHCAIVAAEDAVRQAGWGAAEERSAGVFLGSSRGPTGRLEALYGRFLSSPGAPLPAHSSPTTTLGSIASETARALGTSGPAIGHSVTCSTGLHAVAHGYAWLTAGMIDRAVAGGAEAPLTPFTIAQMESLRIYTAIEENPACRPFETDEPRRNSLALGEGASVLAMERGDAESIAAGAVEIAGIGWGLETDQSATGMSEEGAALGRAMRGALRAAGLESVDAVIAHAPGTWRGSESERAAIEELLWDPLESTCRHASLSIL